MCVYVYVYGRYTRLLNKYCSTGLLVPKVGVEDPRWAPEKHPGARQGNGPVLS